MKKNMTLLGLIVLSAATMALTGCCSSGSCPVGAGKKACKCGASKGSAQCASACKKSAELCKCGAQKSSPACAAACKK